MHAEIDEELRAHIELAAWHLAEQGESTDGAHAEAARRFGDVDRIARECRRVQGVGWGAGLRGATTWATLALACALLSAAAVLAVGIELRDPLTVRAAGWHSIWSTGSDGVHSSLSTYDDFEEWSRLTQAFTHVSAARYESGWMDAGAARTRVRLKRVSPGYATAYDVPLVLGSRLGEGHSGAAPALISRELWEETFGESPSVVGRLFSVGGERFAITGVLSSSFRNYYDVQVLAPFPAGEASSGRPLLVGAQLNSGITRAVAESLMAAAAPDAPARLLPVRRAYGRAFRADIALLGLLGLTLVVAGASLWWDRANRTVFGVRARGPFGRARLDDRRHGLQAVAFGSAVLLGIAWGQGRATTLGEVLLGGTSAVFDLSPSIGVAVGTALLAATIGLVGMAARHGARSRRGVITLGALAACVALALTGPLLDQHFGHRPTWGPADGEALKVVEVHGRESGDVGRLVRVLQGLPGVTDVGATTMLPQQAAFEWDSILTAGGAAHMARVVRVNADFFTLMDPSFRSRALRPGTLAEEPVVVSDTLARALFGSGEPVGSRIALGSPSRSVTVAGVARLTGAPTLYRLDAAHARAAYVVFRDRSGWVTSERLAAASSVPAGLVRGPVEWDAWLRSLTAATRNPLLLMAALAALALLLCMAGLTRVTLLDGALRAAVGPLGVGILSGAVLAHLASRAVGVATTGPSAAAWAGASALCVAALSGLLLAVRVGASGRSRFATSRASTAALLSIALATAACGSDPADPADPPTPGPVSMFEDVSANVLVGLGTHPGMDGRPADVDGDGDLDFWIAGEFAPNRLLLNDGTGVLSDASSRIPTTQRDSEDIGVGDFDEDGDLDVVFVSEDDRVNELYLNDGSGRFTDESSRLPVTGTSNAVLVADLDQDGHLDILIGNAGQNRLLLGDGQAGFTDATTARLPSRSDVTQDLELGDIDGDGDMDLVVANEDQNRVLINDGSGVWTDETETRLPAPAAPQETREADLGDIDGDGDLDLVFANVAFSVAGADPRNRVLINDGTGVFSDETASRLPSSAVFSLDVDLADIDGDGDLDLLVANLQAGDRVFTNDGNGGFIDATASLFPAVSSRDGLDFEVADFDGDGSPEIYTVNRGQADRVYRRR